MKRFTFIVLVVLVAGSVAEACSLEKGGGGSAANDGGGVTTSASATNTVSTRGSRGFASTTGGSRRGSARESTGPQLDNRVFNVGQPAPANWSSKF